jgi:hypothetical protein
MPRAAGKPLHRFDAVQQKRRTQMSICDTLVAIDTI